MKLKTSMLAATFLTVSTFSGAVVAQDIGALAGAAQTPAQVAELAKQYPSSAVQIFSVAQENGVGSVTDFLAGVLETGVTEEQRVAYVSAATQASPASASQIITLSLGGIPLDLAKAAEYAKAATTGLQNSGISRELLITYAREFNRVLSPDSATSLILGQSIADATTAITDDTAETYAFAEVDETFETADTVTPTGSGAPLGFRSLNSVFANFGGGSSAAGSSTTGSGSGTNSGAGAGTGTDGNVDPATPAPSGN